MHFGLDAELCLDIFGVTCDEADLYRYCLA